MRSSRQFRRLAQRSGCVGKEQGSVILRRLTMHSMKSMCDSYSWVKNINTLLSIGLSIVALSFPLALPAVSAKHNPIVTSTDKRKPEHKYVTIPVLYVTDRNMIGETFGSRRRYPIHCQHDIYYGTAMMNVPNTHQTTDGEESRRLGWQLSDNQETSRKHHTKMRIDSARSGGSKESLLCPPESGARSIRQR